MSKYRNFWPIDKSWADMIYLQGCWRWVTAGREPMCFTAERKRGRVKSPARHPVGGLGHNQDLPLVYFTILSREIGPKTTETQKVWGQFREAGTSAPMLTGGECTGCVGTTCPRWKSAKPALPRSFLNINLGMRVGADQTPAWGKDPSFSAFPRETGRANYSAF